MLQSRKATQGNRKYQIIRAGVAAAYNKKPPSEIFTTKSGKDGEYVNFTERRKQLLQEKEANEVKLNWGEPPD